MTKPVRWARRAAVLVLCAAAGPALSDAGGGHAHGAEDAAAGRLEAGVALLRAQSIWAGSCAGCHGPRGRGGPEASLDLSAPGLLVTLSREDIAAALDDGHGGRLAAPLDPASREVVADFVRDYLMLPAPGADVAVGRSIYARSCSVCHGDRGDGASWAEHSLDPAPADFAAHSIDDLSRDEMIDTVTFGSDGTAMMPFATQLDRDEIAATVDYIRTAFMSDGEAGHSGMDHGDHGGGARDMTAPFPGGLVGDARWGRVFYNDNCAECHGEKGDGEGPRAYFMRTKPENFLSREARAELNRHELFEYISEGVEGTVMPAWRTVLGAQEIANVGEYVYRAFIRPAAAAEPGRAPGWSPASHGHGKKN